MAVLASSLRTLKPKSAASAIIAIAGAVALLYYGRLFFITLIVATIIAFILEPLVSLLMRLKIPRALASFLACVAALLVLYLAGLGVYTEIVNLRSELPAYGQRITELIDAVMLRFEEMEQSAYNLLIPKRIQDKQRQVEQPPPPEPPKAPPRRRSAEPPAPIMQPQILLQPEPSRRRAFEYISSHVGFVYQVLLMTSFVPFLVYFMLSWREHIHRSFLQLFEGQDRLMAGNSLEGIASMVRAFVVGNFVLGLLLAVVSSVLFWLLNLPYFPLIGPLSGFLSLVPYIGLPLAMIPPFVAALTRFTTVPPYVLVGTIVAVLHLLALNLFYPKLVGSRVHLNPLVVTVALMIWGVLWGAAGLILAIPLTAAIKAVCDNVNSLQPYGRLLGD